MFLCTGSYLQRLATVRGWEPELNPGLPSERQVPNYSSHHCHIPGFPLAGSQSQEMELGVEPRLSDVGMDSVCFFSFPSIFSAQDLFIYFKKLFILKSYIQRGREGGREISSVHGLTPQMTATKWSLHQAKPGSSFGSPMWVEGSQAFGSSSPAFPRLLAGSWIGSGATRT